MTEEGIDAVLLRQCNNRTIIKKKNCPAHMSGILVCECGVQILRTTMSIRFLGSKNSTHINVCSTVINIYLFRVTRLPSLRACFFFTRLPFCATGREMQYKISIYLVSDKINYYYLI